MEQDDDQAKTIFHLREVIEKQAKQIEELKAKLNTEAELVSQKEEVKTND